MAKAKTQQDNDSERLEIDFDLEPAIRDSGASGSAEEVRRAIEMSPEERAKAAKEQARVRQYVDLPADLKQLIKKTAKKLRVSESQVFCWLAVRGSKYASLDEMRESMQGSRSMRFDSVLPTPKAPENIPDFRRK